MVRHPATTAMPKLCKPSYPFVNHGSALFADRLSNVRRCSRCAVRLYDICVWEEGETRLLQAHNCQETHETLMLEVFSTKQEVRQGERLRAHVKRDINWVGN